jgi:hypothetical protein
MCLAYLAGKTRPDIACSVNILAQYQVQPTKSDLTALKRVLEYLSATRDYGLCYEKPNHSVERVDKGNYFLNTPKLRPVCYADASYAEEKGRVSRTGIVFLFAGAAIMWQSKKQTVVAVSSTEAELYALSEGTRDSLWLLQLMKASCITGPDHLVIHQDNQSTIGIAHDAGHHNRVKHMDVRHRFINDHITKGHIVLQETPTEEMRADFLTKPLGPREHEIATRNLGIRSLQMLQNSDSNPTP